MFGLWYIILGWKEYNKPYRIPPGTPASVVPPSGKPDLIPVKKPDPAAPSPEPPKTPEPPKIIPDLPKPKSPESPKIPELPKPKTPEPPKSPDLPAPKTPETPKIPDLKPKTPESPKIPDLPKPKTPDTPKARDLPPVPASAPLPKTPESPIPKTPEFSRQPNPPKQAPPSSEDALLGKGQSVGRSVNGSSNPKDLSYTKMVEAPGNVPGNDFHVMEAGFQAGPQKPRPYKEEPVATVDEDWESSDEED